MKQTLRLCLLLFVGLSVAHAADIKKDEAAIKALALSEKGKPLPDAIFWSGAYKRPFVAPEKGEEFSGHELSGRTNFKAETTEIVRIEVAASGDLGYEYSLGSVEFDEGTPPQHVAFETGMLRVWKKVDGQWRIAATFVRPLDIPFDDSAENKPN
jgi:ketosteroid isomerase-like protein